MVLHPCSPGGGPLRLRLILDRRISAVFDPIWEGTRAADPDMRSTPQVSHIRAAGRMSGRAGQAAGSGQRAGCRAGPDVGPGRMSGRAAGRMFCLRAGQAGSGHKKTPGDFPRGGVRGRRPGLDQVDTGDQLVTDHLPGGFGGGFVHAVRDLGPNGVDVGDVAVF